MLHTPSASVALITFPFPGVFWLTGHIETHALPCEGKISKFGEVSSDPDHEGPEGSSSEGSHALAKRVTTDCD